MSIIATSMSAVSTMWGTHATTRPRAFTRADRRPRSRALSTTRGDAERLDNRAPMTRYGGAVHTDRPEETPMRKCTRFATIAALALGLLVAGSAGPAPTQAQSPRKLDLAHIIAPPESGAI